MATLKHVFMRTTMENITRNPDGMHSNGYADGIFPQGHEWDDVINNYDPTKAGLLE